MACFAVSYELRCGSEIVRRRLCDELERLGGIEAIGGVYLTELDGTVEEVHDHFAKYLGDRDRLIVIGIAGPPVMRGPLAGAEEWVGDRFAAARVG